MKSYQDYKPTQQQNAGPNQGWGQSRPETIQSKNTPKKPTKKTSRVGMRNKGSLPSGRTF